MFLSLCILLSVLSFSVGLNLFQEVGVSVLFVMKRVTPYLCRVSKLTATLESTVSERM